MYKNKVTNNYVKRYFLFGIFYYKKDIKTFEEEFRILGLPFWMKKVKKGFEYFYLFNVWYYRKNCKKLLYSTILKNIDNKYKHIYMNFNCSGETYLFLSYLKPSNDSVFIATKKYHVDLCHMLHPEIECIYLPNLDNLRCFDNCYKENFCKKSFYYVLPFEHFVNLENRLQKGERVHYCKEICKTMGVMNSIKTKKPKISEEVKKSALRKMGIINLNIKNFVFIAPESQSNEEPSDDFWQNIIDDLSKKGFDVFMNVIKLRPSFGCAKTCFLTFEEAYYVASLSRGIVALRSGFIEPLTSIQTIPILCYYTDFKERWRLKALSSTKVLKGFSLKYLPNVNVSNIYEFNEDMDLSCIKTLEYFDKNAKNNITSETRSAVERERERERERE